MTHNIKNKKKLIAATVALSTMAIMGLTQPYGHTINADDTTTSQSKGLEVSVKHDDLTKAIADAKAAGVSVTQNTTKSQTVLATALEKSQSSILADYQSQTDKINAVLKQQQALNDQYDKDKAAYDTAKAQYDKDKAQYDLDSAEYVKAKAAYDTAKAEYDKKKAQYDKDLATYNTKLAQYQKDLAQYKKDKAAFDAQEAANKDKDGHPSETVLQQLLLNAEDNVKLSGSISAADGHFVDNDNNDNGQTPALVYRAGNKDFEKNKNANGVSINWYHVFLNNGKSFTTTHENLKNASYKGKKIAKMVQTVKNVNNSTADDVSLWVASDPSMGVWYSGNVEQGKGASREITVDRTYYYEDGSKVVFEDDNAYISVGSLNAGYQGKSGNALGNSKHVEKSKIGDSSLITINGGTIKAQSDGWDYADMNSWYNKDGSVFQTPFKNGDDFLPEHTWDIGDSDERWYGTAVYKLKAGTSTIKMSARTDSQAYDTNGATWWTSSTTMPFNTAPVPPTEPIKPTEPKAPTAPTKPTEPTAPTAPIKPKALTASYNLNKLYVTPVNTKDVDAGENVGDKAGSDNDKVVNKGDKLTYSLKASDLPANRVDDITSLKYVDPLPDGVTYKSSKAYSADGKTDMSDKFTIKYDEKSHTVTATATAEYLAELNKDQSKAVVLPIVDVYVEADEANVKFDNSYQLILNDSTTESNKVHNSTVTVKPVKDVDVGTNDGNKEGSDDGKTVVKGQDLTYSLTSSALPANRAYDVTEFKYVDKLPKDVTYQSGKVFSADGKTDISKQFTVTYGENTHTVTYLANAEYLAEMNKDKTKAFAKPIADVYVTANTDNVTFTNTFTETVNQDSNESKAVTNNTPAVTPVKQDLDSDGNDINGQEVKPGATMNYQLTWDLKGIKDASISDDVLAKELSFSDDYDETKLNITATTKTDFTLIDSTTKKSVASEVTLTWDDKKGMWIVTPNDNKAFIKAHGGHEIIINFKPVVKDDATGTLTNTAVQTNFGETYKTETVKNNIVPNPKKVETKTPNTGYGETPKGLLYGAIAAMTVLGAVAIRYRKAIVKRFRK